MAVVGAEEEKAALQFSWWLLWCVSCVHHLAVSNTEIIGTVAFAFHSIQKQVVLAALASKQETQLLWFSQISGAGEVSLRSRGIGALLVVVSKTGCVVTFRAMVVPWAMVITQVMARHPAPRAAGGIASTSRLLCRCSSGTGVPNSMSVLLSPTHTPTLCTGVHWISFVSNYAAFLEKAMATHSSTLAWRIPGMGEPGGVAQSWTRLKRLSSSSSSTMQHFKMDYFVLSRAEYHVLRLLALSTEHPVLLSWPCLWKDCAPCWHH